MRWRVGRGSALQAGRGTASIPGGVIGIFCCSYPSGRTMALESTRTLIEVSTRGISWGVKTAGA